jgi:predicted DNA binding CopG/RHH family protein
MSSTEAQKRAVANYKRKQDNIMIRPTKEEGALIRQAAADAGMSVQAYILEAIRAYMKKDQR